MAYKAVYICLLCLVFTFACQSGELSGIWELEITEESNHSQLKAKVRFESTSANSCIDGEWKRLIVVSVDEKSDTRFPIEQALSYQYLKDKLVIGRNQLCDSYLHLIGYFKDGLYSGKYIAFGIQHYKVMGSFTLKKVAER